MVHRPDTTAVAFNHSKESDMSFAHLGLRPMTTVILTKCSLQRRWRFWAPAIVWLVRPRLWCLNPPTCERVGAALDGFHARLEGNGGGDTGP